MADAVDRLEADEKQISKTREDMASLLSGFTVIDGRWKQEPLDVRLTGVRWSTIQTLCSSRQAISVT